MSPLLNMIAAVLLALVSMAGGWTAAKKLRLPDRLDRLLSKYELGNNDVTTGEELLEQLDEVESEEIADDQKEMIANIVELDQVTAGDIMTHRTDFVAIEADTACRAAIDLVMESGHSRMPVYQKNADHILGILYSKDLLALVRQPERMDEPVSHMVRPASFVPESCPARQLLEDFKGKHTQIAVVVDEYGGTAGLVSLEDVLEEIVGDIQDEYDNEDAEILETEGGFFCGGSTRLEDIFAAFDRELPESAEDEPFDTAGGLISDRLGRIPLPGEQAAVTFGGLSFSVAEAGERHIEKVQVVPAQPDEEES